MTPLTHHDIVRHAAPLVRAGLGVDLAASDRDARRILFRPVADAADGALVTLHSLTVLPDDDGVELTRAVGHPEGIVTTLSARADDAETLLAPFAAIAPERQIERDGERLLGGSWTLEPVGEDARLELRQLIGLVGPLCLVVDVSTGASMPADVLLCAREGWHEQLRATLANGATTPQRQPLARRLHATLTDAARRRDPSPAEDGAVLAALPDDVLAVLGPEWRPLAWQRRRWKGVLRLLGREPDRSERALAAASEALAHLEQVLDEPPGRFHARHAAARHRVFLRRLRPALALLALFAAVPLGWWLFGDGQTRLHPLALGLTPLLMVGVIALSAREIPVLELPPLPSPPVGERWGAKSSGERRAHDAERARGGAGARAPERDD